MLTITPIQNNKYNGLRINPKIRPAFNQKADSFERVSKPIAFKGIKTSELAEKFLAPVLKEPDISLKMQLMFKFQHYCRDIKYIHEDALGVQHNAKVEYPSGTLGKMLFDRAHEMDNYNMDFNNAFDALYEKGKGEKRAQKYDDVFSQLFDGVVNTLKRYEFLIKNGFDKNAMKPEDVFKMAYDYASEYAKNKGVNLVVEGLEVLSQHQNGIFSPKERLADYELYTICANFMQNAAKYSPSGTTVNVNFAERLLESQKYLTISVKDEGIGIKDADWEKALKGERAENAKAFASGTGYGLRRIKSIIQDLQGRDGKILERKSPINPRNEKYPGTEITAYLRLKED